MAVKISQLTASNPITSDDFFPVVDSGSLTTLRASAQQILNYVTGSTFNTLTVTNLTSSNITGTLAEFTTISGTIAQFTTLSSSNFVVSGGNAIFYEAAEIGDNAYILYNSSIDKLAAFPGLYVTGAITASTSLSASNIGATTAIFSQVTASFSGSGANVTNLTASNILNFTNDVRAQFSQGTNITIVGGVISSTGGGGGTPGGTNTTIQFNSGSTFSGSSNFVWDYTNNTLNIGTSSNSVSRINLLANSTENNSAGDLKFVKQDGWLLSLNEIYSTGSSAAYHSPIFILQKSRGTPSSPTAVQNGDQVGGFFYRAYDGTTHKQRAGISAWVDGTVVNNSDVPMRLRFFAGTTEGENTDERFAVARNEVVVNNYAQSTDFRVEGTSDQNLLFVSGGVNRVGIGTSTPNAKLDVNGNTVITGTLLINVDTNSYSVSQFKNSSNGLAAASALQTSNDSGNAVARIVSFGSTNANYTFGPTTLANATGFMSDINTSRMIVSTQGGSNIEIGTNSNTTAYRSILINQGPGNVVINPDNSSAIDFIVESTGSSNMLFVDASANSVGIGTSTPNSTLDVNGNTILSGNLTVTGSIFVSGSSIYGQVAELTSSTTNYTLVRQDSGKFLHMSSSTSMNLTVPSGLPVGFTVSFCQNGTGSINIVTGSGVFVKNRQDHTKTAGYGAVASLICTGSNGYIFTGDTST